MDGVKRVARSSTRTHHAATADHQQRVQKSSTLNRRFVKKPVATTRVQVSRSASAAVQTLRRNTKTNVILTKQNSVNLKPLHSSVAPVSKKPSAAVKSDEGVHVLVQHKTVAPADRVASSYVNLRALSQEQLAPASKNRVVAEQKNIAVQRATAASIKACVRVNQEQDKLASYEPHQIVRSVNQKIAKSKQEAPRLTAQEVKERAIQQALRKMDAMDKESKTKVQFTEAKQKKGLFRGRKLAIAGAMAAVCLLIGGYLTYLNMPDISVRVAAMNAGIERSYPNYVPLGYRLDGLVKEDSGRITMNFKKDDQKHFTLTEEKTAWDSAAVLTNFVKKNWGTNFSIAKGSGLTVYISGSNAVWVNGGVLYEIEDVSGGLQSGDLHDIAVSL